MTSRKICKKWPQFHRKIDYSLTNKNFSEETAQCADKGGGRDMSKLSKTQCVPLKVSLSSHSINVSNPSAQLCNFDRSCGTTTSTISSQKSLKKPSYFLVSSPYFYHFLVLVLLTFAQAAGKQKHLSIKGDA